jgi:hypothetical protein
MATKTVPNRFRERQRQRAHGDEPKVAMALVQRRCRVCEWEGEAVEPVHPPSPAPTCPWCHAPTKRLSVNPIVAPAEGEEVGKNPHAAALGRLGGLKGGAARAAALTPKQRREIAVKAARTRWKKKTR